VVKSDCKEKDNKKKMTNKIIFCFSLIFLSCAFAEIFRGPGGRLTNTDCFVGIFHLFSLHYILYIFLYIYIFFLFCFIFIFLFFYFFILELEMPNGATFHKDKIVSPDGTVRPFSPCKDNTTVAERYKERKNRKNKLI
jgi:hypothetical protein